MTSVHKHLSGGPDPRTPLHHTLETTVSPNHTAMSTQVYLRPSRCAYVCCQQVVLCKWGENESLESLYVHTDPARYLRLCPIVVPLCCALNPRILHPDPGPLCLGTRWTADRGANIPEGLCFRGPAALWDLLSWPPQRDNSIQRPRGDSRGARLAVSAAAKSNGRCAWSDAGAWTRTNRRAPRPSV